MKARKLIFALLVSCGLIDSAYLLYTSFTAQACPIGACTSPDPIPAILGFVWFAIVPILRGKILKVWHVLGLAGIFVLGFYAVLLRRFCPYCMAAYVFGIGVMLTQDNGLLKEFFQLRIL